MFSQYMIWINQCIARPAYCVSNGSCQNKTKQSFKMQHYFTNNCTVTTLLQLIIILSI